MSVWCKAKRCSLYRENPHWVLCRLTSFAVISVPSTFWPMLHWLFARVFHAMKMAQYCCLAIQANCEAPKLASNDVPVTISDSKCYRSTAVNLSLSYICTKFFIWRRLTYFELQFAKAEQAATSQNPMYAIHAGICMPRRRCRCVNKHVTECQKRMQMC